MYYGHTPASEREIKAFDREILCDSLPTGAGDGGGYIVYESDYGPEMLVWDYIPEDADPGATYEVRRISVADDPLSDLDWVDWKAVSRFADVETDEIERLGRSSKPCERAAIYELAASYHGWHELDYEPDHLTPLQMFQLLGDQYFDEPELEFDEPSGTYEAFGPNEDEPENGLMVELDGSDVNITEWTDIEAATGEEQPEGSNVLRQDATVDVHELLDPQGKHRGTYSGDDKKLGFDAVLSLSPKQQQEAVVAAAIAYLAYWGGEETFVDEVGD